MFAATIAGLVWGLLLGGSSRLHLNTWFGWEGLHYCLLSWEIVAAILYLNWQLELESLGQTVVSTTR